MLAFFACFFSFCYSYPKYEQRNDADLLQVQIISRHGARTPLHSSSTIIKNWNCKFTEVSHSSLKDGRPSTQHVSYGKSIFLGDCHFGQLIDEGSKELNVLGKYLRHIYIERLKFLPSEFHSEIMRFRSTNTHRSIHSQIALIHGLYPDSQIPLEIEVAEKRYDPWRRTSLICPNLGKAMKSLIGGEEWQALGLDDDNFTNYISQSLGIKWTNTNDILTTSLCNDIYNQNKFHKKNQSKNQSKNQNENKNPGGLSDNLLNRAVSLKGAQMRFIYSNDRVFPLFGSYPFAEMVNEAIKRVRGDSHIRFIHWSAHDGNILGFLGFLGAGNAEPLWPAYGSYLSMELWRFRKGKQLFFIFRYNGKVLQIPRFSFSRVIPMNDFIKFVKNSLPNLQDDCGFNISILHQSDTYPSETI